MEGIRDGFVGDDCFVCGLLWPGARPCVHCGGRAMFHDARFGDDGVVAARVVRAYEAWRADGDRDSLAALLTTVHLDAPESLAALDDLGCDLEHLRRAWRRCAPELAPDD